MNQQSNGRGWDYASLFAVGGIVFFLNLGGTTLWDADEGRNATAAYEMMESGNWIVPTFNGNLRAHKPVLLYWLQMLAYGAFGVNEFAARLPSALAALATLAVVYELARAMFGRATALLAGLALATTPMMCGAARFANPDSLLNFFTVAYLAGFWFTLRRPSALGFALMGVSAGFGVLAKGPVGVLLPIGVISTYLIWDRRIAFVLNRGWLLALLMFCVVALPWYGWVAAETRGEFLRQFLFKHNLQRGLAAMEEHNGFFGYYVVALIGGTLPWSIFLLASLWTASLSAVREPWDRWRANWERSRDVSAMGGSVDDVTRYRFLLAWMIVFLAFYSVAATKLPNYILPMTAPSVILTARFLHRWRIGEVKVPPSLTLSSVCCLMLMGTVIFGVVLMLAGFWPGPIIPGVILDMGVWSGVGLVICGFAFVCWYSARAGHRGRFVVALALSALVFTMSLGAFILPALNAIKAPQQLVEDIGWLDPEKDVRLGVWDMEYLPSINYYSSRNVEDLSDENEVTEFLGSKLPAYVFMSDDNWRQVELKVGGTVRLLGRRRDLSRRSELVVVTNR